MDLSVEQQRVENVAGIVHRGIAGQRDLARFGIYFNFGKMGAVGVDRRVAFAHAELAMFVKPGFDVRRQIGLLERRLCDVVQRYRAIGSGDREPAIRVLDIAVCGFEHVGGDALALFDDFVGGDADCRTGKGRAARVESADPGRHPVGISVLVADCGAVDAELAGEYLLEGRAVPLAVIHCAAQQRDPARRIETYLGMFEVRAGDRGDGIRCADPEQLAAVPRVFAPGVNGAYFGGRQALIVIPDKIAAVVDVAEAGGERHRVRAQRVAPAQLDGIDAELPGRDIDHRLDYEDRFRFRAAAVLRVGHDVGQRAGHPGVDDRNAVDAGKPAEPAGG